MKSQSLFIQMMYWVLRVVFYLQLLVTVFIISVNSFNWINYLHDEPLTYTVRGEFRLAPNVFKPDTTFHKLNAPDHAEAISLVSRSGWARFDYTDWSEAFSFQNVSMTIADTSIWLTWLAITYFVYALVRSCKNQKIFVMENVARIRMLALSVALTYLFTYIRNMLFAGIAYNHISFDHFTIVMKETTYFLGVFYVLIILIIAEMIRYGMTIKQENDLTI